MLAYLYRSVTPVLCYTSLRSTTSWAKSFISFVTCWIFCSLLEIGNVFFRGTKPLPRSLCFVASNPPGLGITKWQWHLGKLLLRRRDVWGAWWWRGDESLLVPVLPVTVVRASVSLVFWLLQAGRTHRRHQSPESLNDSLGRPSGLSWGRPEACISIAIRAVSFWACYRGNTVLGAEDKHMKSPPPGRTLFAPTGIDSPVPSVMGSAS